MGLFNQIFGKPNESDAHLLLIAGLMACEVMLDESQVSKGAVFEVLLFNSLQILRIYKRKNPLNYALFESEYFQELHKFAAEEKLLDMIPGDFSNFVNQRFVLNSQQLSLMSEKDSVFIPTKIAYNFFEKPLKLNNGDNQDLFMIMGMIPKMNALIKVLDEAVDVVLKDSSGNPKNEFSEETIKELLYQSHFIILKSIEHDENYLKLSQGNKLLATEYFKYISYIISGAVLQYRLHKLSYNDKDEEWKRVIRLVYYNSLAFTKKYATSEVIEFPFFNKLEESYLLLTIQVKLESYYEDIKEFFDTENTCYKEEMESNEEGYGNYINEIQFRFIQDLFEIQFKPALKGISLEFYYKYYDYLDFENRKHQVLGSLASILSIF